MFKDLDSVSVHKHAKKELGQYPAILTSRLVNNPYILTSFQTNQNQHKSYCFSFIKSHFFIPGRGVAAYLCSVQGKFNSSPIDELGKGDLGKVEPRYEPRGEHADIHGNPESGNSRHRHNDRVSGDTYHPIYLRSSTKGREVMEQKHSTGTNGTQSKTARTHTAGKQNT